MIIVRGLYKNQISLKKNSERKIIMNINFKDTLPSFIVDFNPILYRMASVVGSEFEKNGSDVIYQTTQDLLAAIEEDKHVEGWCNFISYILHQYKSISTKEAWLFRDRISEDTNMKEKIIDKFRSNNNLYQRSLILSSFGTIDGFFDDDHYNAIEDIIFDREPVLIKSYIMILNMFYESEEIEILTERILETKNRYLLWGLVEYFGDTLDPVVEKYMDQLDKIEDIVVKERLRFLKAKIAIRNRMFDEGRIEYSVEENKIVSNNVFPFEKLIVELHRLGKAHYDVSDLDDITRRLWNVAG